LSLHQAMLRVAIVSASPLVTAGLRAALVEQGGFEVAGSFWSLAELTAAPIADLDVVLVQADEDDGEFFGGDALADGMPPLVLLVAGPSGASTEWLAEGWTVVDNHAPADVIAAAARAAGAGLVAASRPLMSAALRLARMPAVAPAPSARQRLTPRESAVLAKLAEGLGNKAIADQLHISAHTAKFHVAQIIAKLDATSRAHAVAKALRAGLIQG
jgi:DNA-binding NarL/FixJ family response regulator